MSSAVVDIGERGGPERGCGGAVEWLGGEYATVLALIIDGYGEDRFGVCEAQKCDAVYIDTTRNGWRRYCSAACTARAKVAAYRERRSPDGP